MARDRQWPRPRRATGQDKNTEGSSDRWPVPSCCACMQGGRNDKAGGTPGKKGGKKNTNKTSQRHRRARSAERAGGGRTGWSKQADERPRVAREKKRQQQQRRVTRWGKGTGTGERGGQVEGTTTGPEESTPIKGKGTGGERTVLVARASPGQDADPVGPRQRVAGGPVG